MENEHSIIKIGIMIIALVLLLRANYKIFDIQIMVKRLWLYICCVGYFIMACTLGGKENH